MDGVPGSAWEDRDMPEIPSEILTLRASIDNVDAALMHLLAERFKFTRRVGELKAQGGLPPRTPSVTASRSRGSRRSPTPRASTRSSRRSSVSSSSPRSSGTTS
ncbi:hypothetical protein GCM10025864_43080 [Luteimicrobium album]|uniref:Chorismate mutase domain-containing protein n=1 Tax=Luteimicrobium album TaxID=1054550 RepID=A0ABQ6I969_9MICO|nr:hypothetical protein GCM10025864_43080 [Luteimicrobium album]